jgi:hypothetical protein
MEVGWILAGAGLLNIGFMMGRFFERWELMRKEMRRANDTPVSQEVRNPRQPKFPMESSR